MNKKLEEAILLRYLIQCGYTKDTLSARNSPQAMYTFGPVHTIVLFFIFIMQWKAKSACCTLMSYKTKAFDRYRLLEISVITLAVQLSPVKWSASIRSETKCMLSSPNQQHPLLQSMPMHLLSQDNYLCMFPCSMPMHLLSNYLCMFPCSMPIHLLRITTYACSHALCRCTC